MSDHGERALHESRAIDATRRKGAVAAAGHTGDAPTARAGLADLDGAVRAAALGALVRIGSISSGELLGGLEDPSPAVRRRAAELTWRTSLDPVALVRMLLDRLGDEDEVVEAACASLGELGAREAAAALGEVASGHSDPLCRESAVAALGAIGSPESLPVVLAALGDKPAVRRRAVLALASYEGEEVDAALKRALGDRDWQVRQAAEDLGARPEA